MTTVTANGKTFNFPDGTTTEQIGVALDEYFAGQIQPIESASAPASSDERRRATRQKDRGGGSTPLDVANELASGMNRTIIDGIEFFTTDQVNSILSLAGSDKRIPSLQDSEFVQRATEGGQLGGGLASEIVGGAGEVGAMATGIGALTKGAINQLPKMLPNASTGRRVVEELGKSTASQDFATGALSGAGAEIGEEVGGEKGRLAGAILAPLAPAAVMAGGTKVAGNAAVNRAA